MKGIPLRKLCNLLTQTAFFCTILDLALRRLDSDQKIRPSPGEYRKYTILEYTILGGRARPPHSRGLASAPSRRRRHTSCRAGRDQPAPSNAASRRPGRPRGCVERCAGGAAQERAPPPPPPPPPPRSAGRRAGGNRLRPACPGPRRPLPAPSVPTARRGMRCAREGGNARARRAAITSATAFDAGGRRGRVGGRRWGAAQAARTRAAA